jgi:hypothetical protein
MLAGLGAAVWAPTAWAAAPSFTLDASSPTLGSIAADPGDVLRPAAPPAPGPGLAPPVASLDLSALGLVAGDVPLGMSFGFDALPSGSLHFSVDRGTGGIAGLFPPDIDSEGGSGVAGDVYKSFFPPNHTLVFDGDGVGGSPAPDGLGLLESGSPVDAIAGLDLCAVSSIDPDLDGVLDQPLYFTLAQGSPTLVTLGANTSDIFRSRVGASGAPSVWISGASLGLVPADQLDALATDGTNVHFSLAPGSPTLLGPDGTADPPNDPNPDDMSPADVMSQAFLALFASSTLNLEDTDDVVGLSLGFDQDDDRVPNACDNCLSVGNADQADADVDTVRASCDNCMAIANADQTDTDVDGEGDACDADDDDDGLADPSDNCPLLANPSQSDGDMDGAGDVCDTCPTLPDPSQADQDSDSVGDACDNCVMDANLDQADNDNDGAGDVCDADDDDDGVADVSDNCVFDPNPLQLDNEGDGMGDVCDSDDDDDFVPDTFDNCVFIANLDQKDSERNAGPDGQPGIAGVDDDGINGIDDDGELCPLNQGGFPQPIPGSDDSCGDGIGDVCDDDDDDDGLTDTQEAGFGTDPLVADTDGDGFSDGAEVAAGTDPLDPGSFPGPPAVPALSALGWALLAWALALSPRALLRRRHGIATRR